MASNVPPVRNSSFSFTCRLADQANAGKWKSSPTLASGDVKIRKDGGSANNITTLPTASGTQVTVTLTATEMDADEVVVEFIDAAGNEWGDLAIPIYTVARRIDDLAFPATSGRSMAVDASGNVAADAKLLNGSSTPITNMNTVFNTDFASNYNTTADRWKVDLTHINNAACTSTGGVLEVNTVEFAGVAVGLAVISVDLETIKGQSITCAAPVEFGVYVGGTAAAATQTSVDDLPTNSEMQAMIDALNQSAARRTMLATSLQWEIPESGSNTFKIQLRTYDGDGALTNADSTPTLTATGQVSGSLAANLSSATNPSTGVYVWTYTLASGSTSEQVQLDASATIGGTAFTASSFPVIADFVAATFTTSDRTKIEAVYNKLPSKNYLAGTANLDGDIQLDEATGTPADSAGVTTLLARIPASMIVRSNTAQSGSTSTTIKLDASASATNNLYRGLTVLLTGGTGAGQARTITGYNGTTKIANIDRAWITTPDNTSTFAIIGTNSPALNTNLQVSSSAASATIRTGTAQSGSTSNTIKLDAGASSTNNVYYGNTISITSGTGLGQTRTIVSYNGTTKVASVAPNWVTTPDNTSVFAIIANTTPTTFSDQGVAQAGTSSSITLAATASATDDIYVGSLVTIISGTAAGETSEITDYNGTTKVATVSPNFGTDPDATSAYAVIPTKGSEAPAAIPTAAEIRAEIDANSTQLASIKTDTGNLVARITSTLFSGITSLANWLGAIAGKTADTTTRAEINATTAGAGYNETTDSLEAQKDSGFSLTEERKTVWENWLDYMPITTGTVASDAGNTALSFKTNLTTANGHSDYSGKIVMYKADCPTTSNQLQARRIIKDGHNLTTGVITVDTAFTAVPTAGDPFGIAGYQSSTA